MLWANPLFTNIRQISREKSGDILASYLHVGYQKAWRGRAWYWSAISFALRLDSHDVVLKPGQSRERGSEVGMVKHACVTHVFTLVLPYYKRERHNRQNETHVHAVSTRLQSLGIRLGDICTLYVGSSLCSVHRNCWAGQCEAGQLYPLGLSTMKTSTYPIPAPTCYQCGSPAPTCYQCSGLHLVGRDRLTPLEINMPSFNIVSTTLSLQKTLSDHPTVFSEDLGCCSGPARAVKLSINKDAQPTFCKARPVPFALHSKFVNIASPLDPILLVCDVTDYGIGAVLSHTTEDHQERPIVFISQTLTFAEKHYSQLEKALAIIFRVPAR